MISLRSFYSSHTFSSRVVPLGLAFALPGLLLLILGFVFPLLTILGFSLSPPRTFQVLQSITFDNFLELLRPNNTIWRSFLWSNGLAIATCIILILVAYPIAYGLTNIFGRWASLISNLFVFPLFISENVRLHGWVLFFIKDGVLDGSFKSFGLGESPSILYNVGITLAGMVYSHLPFMLFPIVLGLAMVPGQLREAASDLGANRWQIWQQVELPLAMPGILIGTILTFVLTTGALTEARILGGQSVIVFAHDIETAFTYAQNWPQGSAMAVLLALWVGGLTLALFNKVDLDRILGRR